MFEDGMCPLHYLKSVLSIRMRGGDAFTLTVVDIAEGSVGGVVSVGLCLLLWVQVAGPSGVDVPKMLIEAVGFPGVSLTSTNHER